MGAKLTIDMMDNGLYNTTLLNKDMCSGGVGQSWDDVQRMVAKMAPSQGEGEWLAVGTVSAAGTTTLGLGDSMADKMHRSAIAKLADDLERIKRAQAVI